MSGGEANVVQWIDKFVGIDPRIQALVGPRYINRHQGCDFLVLGNGPSLSQHRDMIFTQIHEKRLIVMGVNRITHYLTPDYIAFCNQKTFLRDAKTANLKKSRALIGQYIPRKLAKKNLDGPFEWLLYNKAKTSFSIDRGIIHGGGRTTTGLLIGVAIVMGASDIYVAGMDGYSLYLEKGQDLWFHETIGNFKGDNPAGRAYYRSLDEAANADLRQIAAFQRRTHRSEFRFLTPTSYNF